MACALSGSSCAISAAASGSRLLMREFRPKRRMGPSYYLRVRASSDEPDECNEEGCAPDKEVGKVSMEWVAGDNTKVTGTFPPRNRSWTGYVEKDTAGQTNIYSVEPVVYIAESAISSGSAGSSTDGSQNTLAIAAGIALVSVAAASSVLIQVDKKSPSSIQPTDYSGPSLSYYINKFKPQEFVEASVPPPAPEISALPTQSEEVIPQPEIPVTISSEIETTPIPLQLN